MSHKFPSLLLLLLLIIIAFISPQCHSITCPPGTFPITIPHTHTEECDACPAGYYCPDGVRYVECPAGTFANKGGSVKCDSCPDGKKSSKRPQVNCVPEDTPLDETEFQKSYSYLAQFNTTNRVAFDLPLWTPKEGSPPYDFFIVTMERSSSSKGEIPPFNTYLSFQSGNPTPQQFQYKSSNKSFHSIVIRGNDAGVPSFEEVFMAPLFIDLDRQTPGVSYDPISLRVQQLWTPPSWEWGTEYTNVSIPGSYSYMYRQFPDLPSDATHLKFQMIPGKTLPLGCTPLRFYFGFNRLPQMQDYDAYFSTVQDPLEATIPIPKFMRNGSSQQERTVWLAVYTVACSNIMQASYSLAAVQKMH